MDGTGPTVEAAARPATAPGAERRGCSTVDAVEPPLTELSDLELADLACAVRDEQRRRALEAGDPVAVAGEGFRLCFDGRGNPSGPRLLHGMLAIPGRLTQRGTSHDCSFCVVDDTWVWDHAEVLFDDVRRDSSGMMSVTVVPAFEGISVTQVESRYRAGAHQRQRQTTWTVTGGVLVKAARTHPVLSDPSHR